MYFTYAIDIITDYLPYRLENEKQEAGSGTRSTENRGSVYGIISGEFPGFISFRLFPGNQGYFFLSDG